MYGNFVHATNDASYYTKPPADQTNLSAWYGKTKPKTTKAHIHQSKQMYYNVK